jgi:hypothetical protein
VCSGSAVLDDGLGGYADMAFGSELTGLDSGVWGSRRELARNVVEI